MWRFFTLPNAVKDYFAPPSAGCTLKMVPATIEEEFLIRKRRWTPPYTLNGFLALEQQIASCGAKQWISFKDRSEKPQDEQHFSQRDIIGAFKTVPRRVLLATRSADNQVRVEEIHCNLMSSLFVFEEFRRKGFAQRMMQEMKTVIQAQHLAQNENLRFIYLYSNVGKVPSYEAKMVLHCLKYLLGTIRESRLAISSSYVYDSSSKSALRGRGQLLRCEPIAGG